MGLTEEEEYAINSWVSSDFYPINEKLRQGIELTNEEKRAITNLDRALEKFPRYAGLVKRSLVISDPTELQRFVNTHTVGNTVTYNEYIAATCGKTYNPDAEVQIYIPQCKMDEIFDPSIQASKRYCIRVVVALWYPKLFKMSPY